MLNKIFVKIWNNPIPAVGISIVIGIFIYAAINAYQNYSFEQTVEGNKASAQNDVKQAEQSEKQADNNQVTRSIEDGVREKVIQPKLQTARRNSAHSAQNLKVAKQNYENKKMDTSHLSDSRADNCRQLADLFANTRFTDCDGAN